jgi:hypothetical protein
MDDDDSFLNSIFAKITGVQGRSRASSDASARQIAREKRRSIYKAMSRPSSGISFTGFDSFNEVRRGLNFLTIVLRFIHLLRRLVVYPIGDMNLHSVSCPFLHMDMLSMLVH